MDVATVNAFLGVHTLQSTARLTDPSLSFRFDECPYTQLTDRREVFKHAQAVFRTISGVETLETRTRELIAIHAEIMLARTKLLAGANRAGEDRDGLALVSRPAAEASVPVPQVAPAETAVHAAGCDQLGFQRLW